LHTRRRRRRRRPTTTTTDDDDDTMTFEERKDRMLAVTVEIHEDSVGDYDDDD